MGTWSCLPRGTGAGPARGGYPGSSLQGLWGASRWTTAPVWEAADRSTLYLPQAQAGWLRHWSLHLPRQGRRAAGAAATAGPGEGESGPRRTACARQRFPVLQAALTRLQPTGQLALRRSQTSLEPRPWVPCPSAVVRPPQRLSWPPARTVVQKHSALLPPPGPACCGCSGNSEGMYECTEGA